MNEDEGININDGLSQAERSFSYLEPSLIKVDERTLDELLEYTVKLSHFFNYYNSENAIEGDWEDFFISDIDILIFLLSKARLKTIIRKFEETISSLDEAEELEEAIPKWNKVLQKLYDLAILLQTYCSKLTLPENRNSNTTSLLSIAEGLSSDFGAFLSGYKEICEKFEGIESFDIVTLRASSISNKPTSQLSIFDKEENVSKQLIFARSWFASIFSRFRIKYSNLITAADYYIKHLQWKGDVYDPHLGLFVTFLHLFEYLQNQTNALTEKHLDYYYNELIQISPQAAVADKMHVVFQSVPTKKKVLLPEGEVIIAEVPDTKEFVQYKLQNDTIITPAQIKELKTGFISQKIQFSSNQDNYKQVEELRMYVGNYAVLQPSSYKTDLPNYQPWPLLGEEQSELPLNERTMEDATIGLVVSSPLLYLEDGKRSIQIKFYLTQGSFKQFQDYISNFSKTINYSPEVVAYNLLNDSIVPSITGPEGWQQIIKYNIRLSSEPAEQYIELTFILGIDDIDVAVYNSEIHGRGYQINAPAVELILNNSLFHHPFSFYKNFVLERITIKAEVTGSKQLQIKNSLGIVGPNNPFQIFGPTPLAGSYLDLKNTNIFNRYTKDCSVHIDWFDLPNEPGGFETYFKSYDSQISNDSYTVSIGSLINGRPVDYPVPKQKYNLFDTVRSDTSQEYLKKVTSLMHLNCNKLDFQNGHLLDSEKEKNWELLKGGSIRIELTEPKDGFGHRLFPQILPGIIAHNTKKFGRKFIVPNIPYIPMAKSVTIDYTLEHTEILRSGNNQDDDVFKLIHIYPFGYKEIYPENEGSSLSFVPAITHESNLLIGLEHAEPASELSLLFQLQEMTYHHTAHELEKISWSYLRNNNWVPVKSADIIADSTNHFANSGIVTIKLAPDIAVGNTILNSQLSWLKASSAGQRTAGSRVLAIFTQAGTAIRNISSDSSAGNSLPPNVVRGFAHKRPDIVNLWQFFSTIGGIPKETTQQYRLRVSERLRHKNKPLTKLDIAQIILEKFPQLLMVKCFGQEGENNLILPGINLQIIVIPQKVDGRFTSDEPKVSLAVLLEIKKFITGELQFFAKAEVGNAVYEKIKVVCSVNLKKNSINSNDGYYINLLNEDIKKFITPWLFDDGQELKIGGKIYISDILDYIKNRPYVNYVSGFSVLHFFRQYDMIDGTFDAVLTDTSKDTIGYIETSRPDAILIASSSHVITLVDNHTFIPPMTSGIGDLVIGRELFLSKASINTVPETNDTSRLADNEDELNFKFDF